MSGDKRKKHRYHYAQHFQDALTILSYRAAQHEFKELSLFIELAAEVAKEEGCKNVANSNQPSKLLKNSE